MHARENCSLVDWGFTVVMGNVVDTPSLLYGTQRWCLIKADKRKRTPRVSRESERDTRLKIQFLKMSVEVLWGVVRRGSSEGQEMEGRRRRRGVWGFYCFQLGRGVVVMNWRPAVFSSAPSPPSQFLAHVPNGFSLCCFVSAYGPAHVPLDADLILLLRDNIIVISHWYVCILGVL